VPQPQHDPFSQKDYFRLLAFFANSDYGKPDLYRRHRFSEARLDLATPEQELARRQLQADMTVSSRN
jgi:hypothetical protein